MKNTEKEGCRIELFSYPNLKGTRPLRKIFSLLFYIARTLIIKINAFNKNSK